MNRKDIIRMATAAGAVFDGSNFSLKADFDEDELCDFARLIAEDCAKRCDEETRIRTDAGNTHPEDSDSRARCFAAARAARICALEIREAYKT